MTVQELIEYLQTFPPELPIYINNVPIKESFSIEKKTLVIFPFKKENELVYININTKS